MALVAEKWGLIPELQGFARAGKPVWGTCAGMIFLAERAEGEQLAAPDLLKHSNSTVLQITTSLQELAGPCRSAVASAIVLLVICRAYSKQVELLVVSRAYSKQTQWQESRCVHRRSQPSSLGLSTALASQFNSHNLCNCCAGMKKGGQALLGGLDICVSRNFFGAQSNSFEAPLPAHQALTQYGGDDNFRAVFIRAPAVVDAGPQVGAAHSAWLPLAVLDS
jgi:glutamine amidotransferase PdxT